MREYIEKLIKENTDIIIQLESNIKVYHSFMKEANTGEIYSQEEVKQVAERAKQTKDQLNFRIAEREWLNNLLSKV